MPRFFYTLLFLALLFLGLGIYTVNWLLPISATPLVLFFISLLGFQTTLYTSFSFYVLTTFFHRLKGRETLRLTLKHSFIISLGTTGLAVLKIAQIFTPANVTLWLAFLILWEIRTSQKRRPHTPVVKDIFVKRKKAA